MRIIERPSPEVEAQTLESQLRNPTVPDNRVFGTLMRFLADRKDVTGQMIPPTTQQIEKIEEIRDLSISLRPAMTEKTWAYISARFHRCDEANLPDTQASQPQ